MKKLYYIFIVCLVITTILNVKNVEAKSNFKIEDDCGDKILTKYKGNDKIVRVPEGVTIVGGYLFKNNKNIKKIILPNTVKEIRGFSFYNLKNLKKVEFSKNIKRIRSDAFVNCPKVKNISIPKKCKYLEGGSISGCYNLRKITVEKGNRYYKVKKGALYTKDMSRLLMYPRKCKKYKTLSIPKEVRRVDDIAFENNCYIEKIIVNSDIYDSQDVGGSFIKMNRLKTVIFKVKQTYDDGLCFAGCKKLNKHRI